MNTSATGGYLQPVTSPAADTELRRIVHGFIAGVTGISGAYVRPKWQGNPASIPVTGTDWCAYGIGNFQAGAPYQVQVANGSDTQSEIDQHERFDVDCSFYGPMCEMYARMVRDGLYIAQNREALWLQGISVTGIGLLTHVPEIVNDVWLDRCDITVSMGRNENSRYNVLHFLSADGTINTDSPLLTIPFSAGAPMGIFDLTFDETFG